LGFDDQLGCVAVHCRPGLRTSMPRARPRRAGHLPESARWCRIGKGMGPGISASFLNQGIPFRMPTLLQLNSSYDLIQGKPAGQLQGCSTRYPPRSSLRGMKFHVSHDTYSATFIDHGYLFDPSFGPISSQGSLGRRFSQNNTEMEHHISRNGPECVHLAPAG
jgi:hypothetical protein